MDAQQIEFAVLKAATTHPKAIASFRRAGITPEFFVWAEEGKSKSPTAWLYARAIDYHTKSGGSLLTTNVVAAEMIGHGVKNDQRSKMLLLWQDIQDTDLDPNDLHLYVEQIKHRHFVATFARMQKEAHDDLATKGQADAVATLSRYSGVLEKLESEDTESPLIRVDGGGCAWADEYRRRRDDPNAWRCTTGLPTLDKAVFGFRPTQIVSVLTPSSGGKSLILMDWSIDAMEQGLNVLYVSFEVDAWTCEMRLNAHLSGVPYSAIKDEALSDDQIEAISRSMEAKDGRGAFVIDDSPIDCTVERVEERIRELTLDGTPPQILVIDYIGLMTVRNASRQAKKHEIQALVVAQLMRIARQHNLLVYTAAQFNRGAIAENRQAKKSGTAFSIGQDGAAGSQELINGSNYVIGIESDREACQMVFHAVKMRDGSFEPFAVAVDPQHYKLEDLYHSTVTMMEAAGLQTPFEMPPPQDNQLDGDWSFGDC